MEEKLIVKLKYYEQEIRVELPMNYTDFTNCLNTMLQMPKEAINKFKIYYINSSDNKEYIIDNSVNYIIFLKNVRNRNTEIIIIELKNYMDNQIEKNNNQNNIIIKKEEKDEDGDLLINPYKESYCADENIIKKNSDNASNNIENDFESLEFSFLEEQKDYNKNENKININNDINNNINMNRNIKNINNQNNNNINKNINSYYGQNKLVDNQIRGVPISINCNIECNYCKNKKMIGIVFYCKNCAIFFCFNCEKNIGIKHPHSYYKIRNKEQFQEICKMHNKHNNKLRNPYDNNTNNYNNNEIENPFKEILSEGSKIIENIKSTTYNSVIKFFNINNNNNSNNSNNNINQNSLKNNNLNNQNNIGNQNYIKKLVEKAKSQYILNNINDDEIERALIISKGNIDKAVELLYSNRFK